MRVVSVLPSATEIVCALGARAQLVGRSAECDTPSTVRELPVVMRARSDDGDRPSSEIDARVQASRAAAESLYVLDVHLLARLRPDVILTQDLCGVCSVTEEEVGAACRAAGVSPRVVSLSPRTLDEVWETIGTVGRAIGRSTQAARLQASLRHRCSARARPRDARVAVVEWLDPPILAGLWTPSMIEAAGGYAIGPAAGANGRRTTWSAIGEARPDLVVISPCSFSVDRTLRELREGGLGAHLGPDLGSARVMLADEAYFSRPGPRLADGVELLRDLLSDQAANGPVPAVEWPGARVAS